MISCIAIDDEPLALEIVAAHCARLPFLDLQKTFTDPGAAARYLKDFPVDLIFLDIQMPDISGIDFYRKHGGGSMVIFTTAFSEYAVEGFNLSAVDYLLKPVEFERFSQAANRARDFMEYTRGSGRQDTQHLFVRSEYSLVKIPFVDIAYIETLDDYLRIFLVDKKPVLTKMNLKNVLSHLNQKEFVRVHRSYIVPLSRIVSVRNKTITLPETQLPIGQKFEDDFFGAYKGT